MNKERLLKLADHLEHGQLAHKKFDFEKYNTNGLIFLQDGVCGTRGCALGECPAIWPEIWQWVGHLVRIKGYFLPNPIEYAMKFFELDKLEAIHLFLPQSQDPGNYGGKILNSKATKNAVADNIRAFIKHKEKCESTL